MLSVASLLLLGGLAMTAMTVVRRRKQLDAGPGSWPNKAASHPSPLFAPVPTGAKSGDGRDRKRIRACAVFERLFDGWCGPQLGLHQAAGVLEHGDHGGARHQFAVVHKALFTPREIGDEPALPQRQQLRMLRLRG